jgi:hypothetical protein
MTLDRQTVLKVGWFIWFRLNTKINPFRWKRIYFSLWEKKCSYFFNWAMAFRIFLAKPWLGSMANTFSQ